MPPSYPFLTLLCACLCWGASALSSGPAAKVFEAADVANPLGLRRSLYGMLVARLMKDSMHNYWHAGRHEHSAGPHGEAGGGAEHKHAPSKTSGDSGESEHGTGGESWLEQGIDRLAELEEGRKTPTSIAQISKAHRRYLEASAYWQLRVAYRLDPGDATLYEIMHYTGMSHAATPEAAKQGALGLARETLAWALSDQSGMSAALTGAGAAINLLNNDMVRGGPLAVSEQERAEHWGLLVKCLERYRQLHAQAVAAGWWERVPQVRRLEVASYAALVEKLSGTIGRKLTALKAVSDNGDGDSK